MAILNNSNAISSGGYDINNSLRFRSSASAYLSRTPASATNQKTWTWSSWVKRGDVSGAAQQSIFAVGGGTTDSTYFTCTFSTSNTLYVNNYTTSLYLQTTQVFRDPSAWYHIVVAVDTTQATAANRVKLYVNGLQVTALANANYPTQNTDTAINSAAAHNIGRLNQGGGAYLLDGYQTEVNFIDGQALTPSSCGETDTITGSWKPKAYTGTYGTNGFYLKFSDIATTSGSNAGLGKDFSGNANYWTTNNISVTAGTTYDAMTDVPTLTSETVANYATFAGTNLGTFANTTITEAGLRVSVAAAGTPDGGKAYAPFGMSDGSGKWYFEMTCVDPGSGNQRLCFGIANITTNPNSTTITNAYIASASGAHGNFNIGTFTTGDVLQVAYDSGSNKLWFGKNNTWYNSGNPVAGTTPTATVTSGITYAPFSHYASGGGGPGIGAWNFGQRPFSYTPPTGFKQLNTFNLPDSTIKKGNTVMDATIYTGDGTTNRTIANAASFRPDLVWTKGRNATWENFLQDSVRGATNFLISNSTNAEGTTSPAIVSSFASNGFVIQNNGNSNNSGSTYVGWQWQAGQGSTSSNTSGSITSTVSVNTTAGFSIVTYTGTGSNATVGHGLGVAPRMIIAKGRGNVDNWPVYHANANASPATGHLLLNTTAAFTSTSSTWNNTAPTSTVFTVGTDTRINQNTITYVAYCWAEIAGFSKFGSYIGNFSADGAFVYTGFRPEFILARDITVSGQEWFLYDTARDTFNLANKMLSPTFAQAETTLGNGGIDFLSNGFKLRVADNRENRSGSTYIYMAFAENPFKNALAR
jgi:hypothetical protein